MSCRDWQESAPDEADRHISLRVRGRTNMKATDHLRKLPADAAAFSEQEFEGRYSTVDRFFRLLTVQGFVAVGVYGIGCAIYSLPRGLSLPLRAIHQALQKFIEITTGIMLPVGVEAGGGLYIGHFGGIIINGGVHLGTGCKISHGMTIGTKGAGRGNSVPRLGDEVYVGTGAVVIGNVSVGNRAIIGANAVVIHDVPAGSIVGGVPARVIGQNEC